MVNFRAPPRTLFHTHLQTLVFGFEEAEALSVLYSKHDLSRPVAPGFQNQRVLNALFEPMFTSMGMGDNHARLS